MIASELEVVLSVRWSCLRFCDIIKKALGATGRVETDNGITTCSVTTSCLVEDHTF